MDRPTKKVILGVGYFKVTYICPNIDKLFAPLFVAGLAPGLTLQSPGADNSEVRM